MNSDSFNPSKMPIRSLPKFTETLHNGIMAWVVLGASVCITIAGWHISNKYVDERARDRFTYEVDSTVQAISKRMEEYEQVLRGGIGLFKASTHVERDEWHAYVSNLVIDTYWPGIQGIGYAVMVKPGDVKAHEEEIRSTGFPRYRISPAGSRDLYSAIIYLEPFNTRNRRAFGYDMYSNPIRREAMDRAARSGGPAMSGKVTLVQETGKDVQAGFLVYLPLYNQDMPIATAEERWQALLGFVYSPFRAKDLLHGILGSGIPALNYQLYDTAVIREENLLYDSHSNAPFGLGEGRYRTTRSLQLQGREWTLVFRSTAAFDKSMESAQPMIVASFGVVIDILLFVVITSLARNRRQLTRQAVETNDMLEKLKISEYRLQRTHEVASIGSWQLDLQTNDLIWSTETYQIFGLSNGAPISFERFQEFTHPDDRERVKKAWSGALKGLPFQVEHRIIVQEADDESIRWVEQRGNFIFNQENEVTFVEGSVQDISERKQSEQALRLSARVVEHARESIIITDADAHIIDINPMYTEMTGYSRDEVIGRNPSMLSSGRHDRAFYDAMWQSLKDKGIWTGELWNKHKNGSLFLQKTNISAVIDPDAKKISHYVAMGSDITEAYEQKKQLEELAMHDPLTGLANRNLFMDRLEHAISRAKRRNTILALAFIDLDGFKPVNDQHGHAIGDQTLIEVAKRLLRHLREEDTAARLGGDEFCILYSDVPGRDTIYQFLQRVLDQLNAPYFIGNVQVRISASIGIAIYPDHGETSSALLHCADQFMYQAKEKGKNQIVTDPPLIENSPL